MDPLAIRTKRAQTFASAKSLYDQLRLEWYNKSPNVDTCGQILSQLKVLLTELTFLPTFPTDAAASNEELLLAREVLEIGVEWSISVKDIPSFERYMSQLKSYYLDYKTVLPESKQMYPLLGLNLLFLLSQNRVAEFHTELELLPADKLENNLYIKHSVSLEQYLMEGRYNKIFAAAHIVPAPFYRFFMDRLLKTVRNDIAECLEKAYTEISVNDAVDMLNLPSRDAAMDFASTRFWKVHTNGHFIFAAYRDTKDIVEVESPDYVTLIGNMLEYAREMESII